MVFRVSLEIWRRVGKMCILITLLIVASTTKNRILSTRNIRPENMLREKTFVRIFYLYYFFQVWLLRYANLVFLCVAFPNNRTTFSCVVLNNISDKASSEFDLDLSTLRSSVTPILISISAWIILTFIELTALQGRLNCFNIFKWKSVLNVPTRTLSDGQYRHFFFAQNSQLISQLFRHKMLRLITYVPT